MNLLDLLRPHFSPDALASLCAALQEIPALEAALQEKTLFQRALERLGDDPLNWTPAALAFSALEYPRTPKEQTNAPAVFPDPQWEARIRGAARRAAHRESPLDPPLPQAALLALGLQHNLRSRGLTTALETFLARSPADPLTLAVLFGLLPDPADLVHALLLRPDTHDLLWRVVLSQPLPAAHQRDLLIAWLRPLPSALLPPALTALHNRRPALTTDVRRTLQPALLTLPTTWEQGRLFLSAWDLPIEVQPASPTERVLTALHFVQRGDHARAADLLSANDTHPATKALQACLSHAQGDRQTALQHAQAVVDDLRSGAQENRLPPDVLIALAEVLLSADETVAAVYLLAQALTCRPADPALLIRYAHLGVQAGMKEQALHPAQLACALTPDDPASHRALADVLEANARWEEALQIRRHLVDLCPESPADHSALAACALHGGEVSLAQQAAEQALKLAPQDGNAHLVMGQVYAAAGKHDEARQYYRNAARALPHRPEPWLALTEDAGRRGEHTEALEILRTAVQAAPHSPLLHLRLGRLSLQSGLSEGTLTALQTAARLVKLPLLEPDQTDLPARLSLSRPLDDLSAAVAATLGETWQALGRPAHAALYLRVAYHHAPADQQLAWRYAVTLRDLRRLEEAQRILETLLQAHPPFADPYLEYARTVLERGQGVDVAIPALQTVLQFDAQHPEAHALLAEALVVQGDFAAAEAHYQQAMQSSLVSQPAWEVRLILGRAHLALAQQQPETAIALLQEALHRHPNHAPLYQALYQAYLMGNLHLEARDLLDRLYPLYAETPTTLVWLGEQARVLQHGEMLVRVLEDLRANPPQDADTLMRWGLLCAQAAPEESAEIFGRLIADPHTPADVLTYAGEHLLRHQQPGQALMVLQSALQRADEGASPTLWASLAEAYRQNDALEQALSVVADGLQHYPADCTLLKQGARLYLQVGRPNEALPYLEAITTHTPEDLEAHTLLLDVYRQVGDLVAAYRHARWLVDYLDEHLPHSTSIRQARLIAAELACMLLDFQTARDLLPPAQPEEAPHSTLGLYIETHLALGEEVAAAQLVQVAVRRFPQAAETLAWQARLLMRQSAPEEARRFFKAAQAALPQAPAAVTRWALARTALYLDEISWCADFLAPAAAAPHRTPWEACLWLQSTVRLTEESLLRRELRIANFDAGERLPGDSASAVVGPEIFQSIETVRADLRALFTQADLSLPPDFLRWERRALWLLSAESLAADDLPTYPDDVAARLMAMRRFDAPPDTAQAAELARRAPHAPLVWLQLACTLEANSAWRQALSAVEQALKLAGESPWCWRAEACFVRARLHFRLHDFAQAQQALEPALQENPVEVVWQQLGWQIALQMAQPQALVKHGEALRALVGLSPEQMRHLAQAYRTLGETTAAVEILQETVAHHPEDAVSWVALADLYAEQGEWVQVARCAERSLEAVVSAEALRLRVLAALRLGDGRAARSRAQRLTELSPTDPQAWYFLAQAWEMLHHSDEALSALRIAIDRHPNPPLDWHLRFLTLLEAVEGPAEALRSARALWNAFPDAAELPQRVVRYALGVQDEAAALTAARHALQKEEQLGDAERAFLQRVVGALLFRQGHLDQALQYLVAATQAAPQDKEAWLLLGQTYAARHELRRAAEALEHACRLSPDDPQPYRLLGEVYRDLKLYREAERAIRHAAALAPQNLTLQRMLASLTALNIVYG